MAFFEESNHLFSIIKFLNPHTHTHLPKPLLSFAWISGEPPWILHNNFSFGNREKRGGGEEKGENGTQRKQEKRKNKINKGEELLGFSLNL